MSFLGSLFGTVKGAETALKIVDKTTDGVIGGIDAAFYTKEEQMADRKEILLKLQDQFTPRAISRRLLALLFSGCFCGAFVTSIIFACFKRFDIVDSVIKLVVEFQLPWIILTIVTFYFGYYGLKQIKGEKKK